MLMSFTDPLSITISGTTTALPRVSVGDDQSEYKSSDGLIIVSASHNYGKRTRRSLRIDTSKIAPDPYRDDQNVSLSMSHYLVFDVPPVGYSAAEIQAVYTGLKGLYTGSSDAMITKLLDGES
jgi:hypothetical protein